MKGISYVVDGKELAVSPNSVSLCRVQGFHDEVEVPVIKIIVHQNGFGRDPIDVGPGKYKSALWAYCWYQQLPAEQRCVADGMYSFVADEAAREDLRAYVGEKIAVDAVNNPDTKHTFVRDVLRGDDVIISFV